MERGRMMAPRAARRRDHVHVHVVGCPPSWIQRVSRTRKKSWLACGCSPNVIKSLATRAWGMSGPVRTQEQNRTEKAVKRPVAVSKQRSKRRSTMENQDDEHMHMHMMWCTGQDAGGLRARRSEARTQEASARGARNLEPRSCHKTASGAMEAFLQMVTHMLAPIATFCAREPKVRDPPRKTLSFERGPTLTPAKQEQEEAATSAAAATTDDDDASRAERPAWLEAVAPQLAMHHAICSTPLQKPSAPPPAAAAAKVAKASPERLTLWLDAATPQLAMRHAIFATVLQRPLSEALPPPKPPPPAPAPVASGAANEATNANEINGPNKSDGANGAAAPEEKKAKKKGKKKGR
jgi:hypothetical protein